SHFSHRRERGDRERNHLLVLCVLGDLCGGYWFCAAIGTCLVKPRIFPRRTDIALLECAAPSRPHLRYGSGATRDASAGTRAWLARDERGFDGGFAAACHCTW